MVYYYNGTSRSAAILHEQVAVDYKNHILGYPNYAIQGNILLGHITYYHHLMEYYFQNTSGCLPEKLMAAMNGAKVVGARILDVWWKEPVPIILLF